MQTNKSDKYLIPISEIEKTESTASVHVPKFGFFFCGHGWQPWIRYCVYRNIPFRLYQRWDMGGDDLEFFHVKEDSHKEELRGYFQLKENQVGTRDKIGDGSFWLMKTNCTDNFEQPKSLYNIDTRKFLFYNKHIFTEEILNNPYILGTHLRVVLNYVEEKEIQYSVFK